MSEVTAQIKLTPEMMAKAFWSMSSNEQVAFFDDLAAVIRRAHEDGNTAAYSMGELQWLYVGHELHKVENERARSMLMTMAAPVYMHTLMYCEAHSTPPMLSQQSTEVQHDPR